MRNKTDHSNTPAFHEGYQRGTTIAGAWRTAKRTLHWKRSTRTEFRNYQLAKELRYRDTPDESVDAQAFSQGFVTAYTRAFARTCGH